MNVTGPADHWNLHLAGPLDFFAVPDQRTTANFEPWHASNKITMYSFKYKLYKMKSKNLIILLSMYFCCLYVRYIEFQENCWGFFIFLPQTHIFDLLKQDNVINFCEFSCNKQSAHSKVHLKESLNMEFERNFLSHFLTKSIFCSKQLIHSKRHLK